MKTKKQERHMPPEFIELQKDIATALKVQARFIGNFQMSVQSGEKLAYISNHLSFLSLFLPCCFAAMRIKQFRVRFVPFCFFPCRTVIKKPTWHSPAAEVIQQRIRLMKY